MQLQCGPSWTGKRPETFSEHNAHLHASIPSRRSPLHPQTAFFIGHATHLQIRASQRSIIQASGVWPVPATTLDAHVTTDAGPSASAEWTDGDVLRLHLVDGRSLYAEVLEPPRQSAQRPPSQQRGTAPRSPGAAAAAAKGTGSGASPLLLCQGTRYAFKQLPSRGEDASPAAGCGDGRQPGGEALVLDIAGGALAPNEPLLVAPPKEHAAALRAWAPLASRLIRVPTAAAPAQTPGGCPADGGLDGAAVQRWERVCGLAELRGKAAAQSGSWCDGTGPNDPPLSEEARALYTAGELACLLEGHRGVVLLQLHVGWDAHDAVPPYGPYKPLVLRLLREALGRPDIVSYASAVPAPGVPGGNAAAGLTLVLCADREPFRSWGAHLASFGCQAALEAQSPYYKLLVGRVLGYQPGHVAHHIKATHGSEPSREVVAAVEQQLARLSPKQPRLPWNASARGGGRKKAK